ncbi:PREDICTED: COP9 signalosome complex subunit 7-like isoform X1 [Prunus mume]|uniref:COP9 signalosome complex subunit 7-like isoform X1 n=1 Tax=Prunus mume TaxID=102107 RepID=A0ABM0P055_PRUMU|nr:PREDICTED: COP9 signalosome complex subunit 7-like isoform X1 [Prunus mume]
MDIEQKQEEIIDHFVKQASSLEGSALGSLVVEATSHPSLFAFSEILAVPNVLQLEGTETSVNLDVLRLFSQGTWSDYKRDASRLPQLVPDQVLKLKQLTVLTLAETNKVLPYDQLMQELDVINVRELEDFLINECMYAGIVRGKLDQLRKCFEVQFAAGRDPRPGQLGSMIHTLSNWLDTSNNLLISIQEKMKWADTMTELAKEHKKEVEDRVEEVKKSSSHKADIDFRGHEEIYSEPGGVMDYEEDRSRPKRIMCTYQANRMRVSNVAILQDHQGDSVLKRLRGSHHPHLGVPQLSPQGYICYATHWGDNWLDKFWIEIL